MRPGRLVHDRGEHRARRRLERPLSAAISLRGLNRATLARQLLLERERLAVPEAVERLAGLQAQEPRPPFVGLWTRLDGFEAADLLAAERERTVVRATWLRATLHLVSARDYLAFRTPLAPMLAAASRGFGASVDVDELLPVARKHLAGGARTFTELRALLGEAFPEAGERALGYLVRLQLPLVMVATEDPWGYPSPPRFTLAEEWLGAEPDSDGSPAELVRRYLAAYGPATAADVQTWSGLKGVAKVIAGLGDELERVGFGRQTMYDLPGAPRPDEDTPAPARFLPAFDNLLLAHKDRGRVVPDAHKAKVMTKNLRVHPTFLVDGLVAGTWATALTRGRAALTVRPFEPLAKGAAGELEAEGARLLRFSEPGAGAHEVVIERP